MQGRKSRVGAGREKERWPHRSSRFAKTFQVKKKKKDYHSPFQVSEHCENFSTATLLVTFKTTLQQTTIFCRVYILRARVILATATKWFWKTNVCCICNYSRIKSRFLSDWYLSIVFQLERQGEGQGRAATPAAAASTTGGVSGAIRIQSASSKFLQAEPDTSRWQKHKLILKGLKDWSVFYSEAAETPVKLHDSLRA